MASSLLTIHVLIPLFFLVLLGAGFVIQFYRPASRLGNLLKVLEVAVDKASKRKASLAEIRELFSIDERLGHLWKEYQESLYLERQIQGAEEVVVGARASVPAEIYWNPQSVVDGRVHAEFTKHIPGLLTGVGIIGTFWGIIEGLSVFQVSDNPGAVRQSLETLMHAVGSSFGVSATAIFLAMAFTGYEKWKLSKLYRHTEKIAESIDARFDAGASEEFLARLVESSEETTSQVKILKDSLVKELGEVLRQQTEAQIQSFREANTQLQQRMEASAQSQIVAAEQQNRALGDAIAQSIREGLAQPLEDIKDAVKQASGDQSAAAIGMLKDVMTSFSQRLNDLFGGQINGINELNQETSNAMQAAVQALNGLVGKLEESQQRSGEAMSERLTSTLEAMELHQQSLNNQNQAFIEQLKLLITDTQSATSQKLEDTLDVLNAKVASMLEQQQSQQSAGLHTLMQDVATMLDTQRQSLNVALENLIGQVSQVMQHQRDSQDQSLAAIDQRQQVLAQQTDESVGALKGAVDGLVKGLGEATAGIQSSVRQLVEQADRTNTSIRESVSLMANMTSSTVKQMGDGAAMVSQAAEKLRDSGIKAAETFNRITVVTNNLNELSGKLSTSATALQSGLTDYKAHRESLSSLVANLSTVVENAKAEAGMTQEVLSRIQSATRSLVEAQHNADNYLAGISDVLAKAHDKFSGATIDTLSKVNISFHKQLETSVALLNGAIQELEASLGNLAPGAARV